MSVFISTLTDADIEYANVLTYYQITQIFCYLKNIFSMKIVIYNCVDICTYFTSASRV